jgi:primosomal protein N' (replication factor Y)
MARVVVRGESQIQSEQMAEHIAEHISKAAVKLDFEISVLGPAVAPVEKLRGMYRFHILIGSITANEIQTTMVHAKSNIKNIDGVQWIVDIDPQDMI